MITVGTIQTNSVDEKFTSIFIMLMLAGTFAYSISTIGIILQEMNKDSLEIKLL